MGLGISFSDIPKLTGGLWPEGKWLITFAEAEKRHSSNLKLMTWVNFVGDTEEVKGRQGFHNFVFGVQEGDYKSEEYPEGRVTWTDLDAVLDERTWKEPWLMGPKHFNALLEACSFVGLDSMDPSDPVVLEKVIALLAGQKCVVEVYNTTQKKGDYKGTEQNNFRFEKVGARVGPKGKSPVQAAPMSPPSAPVVAPAPKVEAAPAGEVVMVNCPKCKQDIPSAEFGPHVMACPGAWL